MVAIQVESVSVWNEIESRGYQQVSALRRR